MNQINEAWRPVIGFEGYYDVSNLGNIRSYFSGPKLTQTPRLLPVYVGKRGYKVIAPRSPIHRKGFKYIHRLVAEAFIPNPQNLYSVNHKNGIKTDNRVENLEWMSMGDNLRHARNTGLHIPSHGENHSRAKLTVEKVKEIIRLRNEEKLSGHKIAKIFGVTRQYVYALGRGDYWKRDLFSS